MKNQAQIKNSLVVALGAWLFATPWIFGTLSSMPATSWNFWISGALIMLLAVEAIFTLHVWHEGGALTLAIWLAICPWLMGYDQSRALTWSSVAVAVGVMALSASSLSAARRADRYADQHAGQYAN